MVILLIFIKLIRHLLCQDHSTVKDLLILLTVPHIKFLQFNIVIKKSISLILLIFIKIIRHLMCQDHSTVRDLLILRKIHYFAYGTSYQVFAV